MSDLDRVPMDVDVGWGKESLARFMRAVVRFGCQVTDSFTLAGYRELRGTDSVFLRVQIPRAHLDAFRVEARPQGMREPPRIDLGRSHDGEVG